MFILRPIRMVGLATLLLGAPVISACSGSPTGPDEDDGDPPGAAESPSPSVPAPAGCGGTPVGQVEINVNGPARVQVFEETVAIEAASGGSITRSVVPCEYAMTVRSLRQESGAMLVWFLRTAPYERNANPGGVEKGSIVVEEGDGRLVPDNDGNVGCLIELSDQRRADAEARTFRLRFRVVGGSNADACL